MNRPVDITAVRADPGRDAVTWYSYLLLGYFTYLIGIQGNILPFLQAELALSYGAVSLHTSVIAIGLLAVGLFGDRFSRRYGRSTTLRVGIIGSAGAAALLAISPVAAASIASCALLGLFGGLIPMGVNATLSDVYGSRREVAFSEANAVAYAFAIMAPILSGLCVWLGWDWRVALLAGAAVGVAIMFAFLRTPIPGAIVHAGGDEAKLPAAFWFYTIALGFAVALEFSVLLWAPAYLERVVGLEPTEAAIGAAAFFLAMLGGRVAGTWLVRVVQAPNLLFGACGVTLVGFTAYWSGGQPPIAVAGLFVLGLGISLTFPLLLGFAMGAAGPAIGRAATRIMLAPAVAVLVNPPLLGALADFAGLRIAQFMTPALTILALAAFLVGQTIERTASQKRPPIR